MSGDAKTFSDETFTLADANFSNETSNNKTDGNFLVVFFALNFRIGNNHNDFLFHYATSLLYDAIRFCEVVLISKDYVKGN